MDTFFRIVMKTHDDKKLYLKSGIGKSCEWSFDKSEAIWFETKHEADSFCNDYFKSFKNYIIEQFSYVY